jgi:hypothetical protein
MAELRSKVNAVPPEQTSSLLYYKAKNKIMSFRLEQILSIVAVAIVSITLLVYLNSESDVMGAAISTKELKTNSDIRIIHQELSPGNATMILELMRSEPNSDTIAVGQHKVQVTITNKACEFPQFWIRLVGDALVPVELSQVTKSKYQNWNGVFNIPIKGTYKVDARWYGCTENETSWTPLHAPIDLHAVGKHSIPEERPKEAYLFADSAWVATRNNSLPEYMWMDLDHISKPGKSTKVKETTIYNSATLKKPNEMYMFMHVGNYELVCFWGSKTMYNIREKFLAIRKQLTPSQRPFKFHYYNVSDLIYPDKHWSQSSKEMCRKCKHILVSVDEFEVPVSQMDYEKQMTTHIGHLQALLNDTTFPIWIFSVNEPPMQASNCHSPKLLRTTDHPCNDVLKRMFRAGEEVFPEQVHFMDNTDLVQPQFDQNRDDVLSNIAMRIFVAVGRGVSVWRAMGQSGKIDGLHRNGTVEPNFKLVPYDGWNS